MKQVIVVRKDLGMRKGKLAAQVAHASVDSILTGNRNQLKPDSRINLWLETGMAKIVVGCDSSDELLSLVSKCMEKCVSFSLIKDAGKTELEPGTMTCLAIGPDEDYKIDQITEDLKLL